MVRIVVLASVVVGVACLLLAVWPRSGGSIRRGGRPGAGRVVRRGPVPLGPLGPVAVAPAAMGVFVAPPAAGVSVAKGAPVAAVAPVAPDTPATLVAAPPGPAWTEARSSAVRRAARNSGAGHFRPAGDTANVPAAGRVPTRR